MNPIQGLKRLFSIQSVVRLLLGLFKVGVVVGVAGVSLYFEADKIMTVSSMTVPQIAAYLAQITQDELENRRRIIAPCVVGLPVSEMEIRTRSSDDRTGDA